jgi:hypothetical protein
MGGVNRVGHVAFSAKLLSLSSVQFVGAAEQPQEQSRGRVSILSEYSTPLREADLV